MNAAELHDLNEEIRHNVDQTIAKVSNEPAPDPFKENWHALSSADLVEGQHEA